MSNIIKGDFTTSPNLSSTNENFTSNFEDPVLFLYPCFCFLYRPVLNKARSF